MFGTSSLSGRQRKEQHLRHTVKQKWLQWPSLSPFDIYLTREHRGKIPVREHIYIYFFSSLSIHIAFARHSQECNPDYLDQPLFWSQMPLEGEQKGHAFPFVGVHSLCNPWIGSDFFLVSQKWGMENTHDMRPTVHPIPKQDY